MHSPDGGFRAGFVGLVAVVGVAAFAAAILLSSFEGEGRFVVSAGSDSFSYSAVGHRAFVTALGDAGAPIEVAQNRRPGDAGAADLVLYLEPDADALGEVDYDDRGGVAKAKPTALDGDFIALVALPKRLAITHPASPRRVMHADPADISRAQNVIDAILGGWEEAPGLTRLASGRIDGGVLAPGPELADVQVLPRDAFDRPLATVGEHAVAGFIYDRGRRILLVTDPDVFANFMMDEDDAAAFAARLVDFALPAGGRILVDEEIHGFGLDPNLVRAMLEPPFLQANLAALAAALLAVWAGLVRFAPARRPPPRELDVTDAPLLEASAELVVRAGDLARVADRYALALLRRAAQVLHVRDGRDDAQLLRWAADLEESRGLERRFAALRERAASPLSSATARANAVAQLRTWYEDITHGSGTRRPAG